MAAVDKFLDCDTQIGLPPGFKAKIWKYFGFEVTVKQGVREFVKEYAICKFCRFKCKYCNNTTNLINHIRRRHPSYACTVPDVPTTSANAPSSGQNPGTWSANVSEKQPKIHGALLQIQKLSADSSRSEFISNLPNNTSDF